VDDLLSGRSAEAELEAAGSVLATRVREPLADDRARARTFALLVRRGYEAKVAHEAVRRHERRRPGAEPAGGRSTLDAPRGRRGPSVAGTLIAAVSAPCRRATVP
jgi:hypothetical protein